MLKFSSAWREWRHMGGCVVRPRCTAWTHGCWKIINPFLWHRDTGTHREFRTLPRKFPGISGNMLGCAKRADTGPFRPQPPCLRWNHLTKSINYQRHTVRNVNVKTEPELEIHWICLIFWYELINECEIEKGRTENNLNNKMQMITTLLSFTSRLNPEAKMAQRLAGRF